jgi:hypothetical protein
MMCDMTLLESTLKLLHRATGKGISLREIAPENELVEYEWLKKFYAGKIEDPSVNRIQALHDRLSKMDLEAA